jgi:hypothetical protein
VTLQLTLLAERFAVCRLPPGEAIPQWATGGPFLSISRTSDELSIVCLETSAPHDVQAERGWRCLKVEGPIPFEVTGVAAALTAPLAAAGISLFLVSTYDTDYLLVKEPLLERAIAALGGGFSIR